MEEKPASAEETVETPAIEQPPAEPPAPSFREKLKIHKFKIFGGVLGVLVFTGAVFGAYKLAQRQIQPSPTPSPAVVATPTPDLTANWKTYTNTKYGYSIKYPLTWNVVETETHPPVTVHELQIGNYTDLAGIPYEDLNGVNLSFYSNPRGLNLEDFAREGLLLINVVGQEYRPKSYGILSGLEFKYNSMGFIGPVFITEHKNNVIYFRNINSLIEFNLMLSTFRFLESDEAQIREVLDEYIPEHSLVRVFELEGLKILSSFAKVTVVPKDIVTDKAMVILEKVEGEWIVIWGPGTAIGETDPVLEKIPEELLD